MLPLPCVLFARPHALIRPGRATPTAARVVVVDVDSKSADRIFQVLFPAFSSEVSG
jgi:hypothetical protein